MLTWLLTFGSVRAAGARSSAALAKPLCPLLIRTRQGCQTPSKAPSTSFASSKLAAAACRVSSASSRRTRAPLSLRLGLCSCYSSIRRKSAAAAFCTTIPHNHQLLQVSGSVREKRKHRFKWRLRNGSFKLQVSAGIAGAAPASGRAWLRSCAAARRRRCAQAVGPGRRAHASSTERRRRRGARGRGAR